ncbi:MAG: MFS transporter [Clostridia bacterium]|nr:MFS transporter [Clostridia bacterium]
MSKKRCVLFAALEMSYWCFHASFIGYAAAYLLAQGVSNTAVSLLLAGYMLLGFIGSLAAGNACDRFRTNKKVFMLCMLMAYGLMFALYFRGAEVAVAALCYPLLGFFFLPQGANIDSWLLDACARDQRIFGRIRCMPSLAYAVVCALFGQLIARFGYHVMIPGATFFFAVTMASAALLPDAKREAAAEKKKASAGDVGRLFAAAPYRRLVVLLFLLGLATAPMNNLKIVVLESVGGNVSHVGVDAFVGAMTQVPFIAMAALIHRLPLRVRFLSMSFLLMLMPLTASFAVSPAMVYLASFFYNVGYGILLTTMRDVTELHVDRDIRNLGHTLSDAVFTSFSGVISLMYAGALTDALGVRAMLAVCAAICAVPVVISLLPQRVSDRKSLR